MNHAAGESPNPLELYSERARGVQRPPYAVVDIGSNSVRLVVYEELGRAPFSRFNEKSLCRLGAGLNCTNELALQSIERTVAACRRFRAVADAMGVRRIDAIATEAVRRASNGTRLVDAIAREAGLSVRILSGEEEAHHAALGVIAGFYRPAGLVGDMGGGSLEVAEALFDRVGERCVSLPLGTLPVQALLADDSENAKRGVDAVLKAGLPPALTQSTFYAVGGGWRALAKALMAATSSPLRVAHGYAVQTSEARDFAKSLWRSTDAKIAALPGVPTRRAATLRASALVLDRVLKRLAPERAVFSALGLREGWLYAQLPMEDQSLDPLIEGAYALGTAHARVPEFARALVRWTDDLFSGETYEDQRLRIAACALSDIAWREDADVRGVQSFQRLVAFPFVGLDHSERVFIAAAVHGRYGGSSDDPSLAAMMALLAPAQRRRALILGRVLRLGYRLSGSVPFILSNARLVVETDRVRLTISEESRVPDSEVVKERLDLVAVAIGVRETEIVVARNSTNGREARD